jgi:hypothetical protein
MPINSKHPDFDEYEEAAELVNDCLEGDVVEYIPKKESQTQAQYEKFRKRPSFYNVVERTASALVGALTRKPARLEGVAGEIPNMEDGDNFEEFIQEAYSTLLAEGRMGILVDFDEENNQPYLVTYPGTSIINWCEDFIIIEECYYGSDPKDKYEIKEMQRYRELTLDEAGIYTVNIWEEVSKDRYEITQVIQPMVRGAYLTEIPFTWVNQYDTTDDLRKPPLFTLAQINVEHFVLQAGLAHMAWVLASPTPTIIGDLQGDETTIGLGGDKFIHLRAGGSAQYMEFSGTGADFVLSLANQKEVQMFSLGSRLLQYKAGVESSDALQIRLGAEGASLMTMRNALNAGLTKALTFYNQWFSSTVVPVVDLNSDFSPANMTPQEITSLLQLYAAGAITLDIVLKRLYEGEIVDEADLNKPGVLADQQQGPAPDVGIEGAEDE